MEKNGKGAKEGSITEGKYKKMWDELYEAALSIPNMSHSNAPKGDESQAKVGKGWCFLNSDKDKKNFVIF